MKRHIFFVLTLITFLFSSCSNLFEDEVKTIAETQEQAATDTSTITSTVKYITVSGSVELEGAYPDNVRTAFPTKPLLSGLSFTVEAKNLTDSTSTSTTVSGGSTYSISIPVTEGQTKRYKICITAKDGSYSVLKGESQEFDISEESTVCSENIRLHAIKGDNTKGGIELYVNFDSDTNIYTASVTINGGTYTAIQQSSTQYNFSVSSTTIPTGSYPARFSFINGSSEEIFSFTQTVNIFSGLLTNTWVKNGSEAYFESDSNGNIICHLTKAIIESYELKEIFVDSTCTTSNPPEEGKTYSTGSGTFLNPVPNFDAALSKLQNKDKDYTIYIKGTQTGTYVIPSTLKNDGNGTSGNAKSLTICGFHNDNTQDIFNGNNSGPVLKDSSSVPITIKNLTITGGRVTGDNKGGGLYVEAGSVTLSNGALISQNKSQGMNMEGEGGGVYVASGAKLFMYGTASISNNLTSGTGGGISNDGDVYLGYSSETTKCELKSGYGITGNQSYSNGCGIFSSGNIYMASGNISNNTPYNGSNNVNGGAICLHGNFTMYGGLISGNSANSGGGIEINPTSVFTMQGGEFSNNSANTGGAIYQSATFILSGTASIPAGVTADNQTQYGQGKNDVHIDTISNTYKNITIAGSLSKINKDNPVSITAESISSMQRGTILVAADDTNISDISSYNEAFVFSYTDTEWELFNSANKKSLIANMPFYVAGLGTAASPKYICDIAGNDTSGNGSKERPYASIAKAIQQMNDYTLPYVIKVDGTILGKQEISSSLTNAIGGTYRAASVVIQGASSVKNDDGSPRDCLNGNFSSQAAGNVTLTIGTKTPLTFTNITIKGGYNLTISQGGGIYISNSNSDVTLDENAYVINNKAKGNGAGIYNSGKLTIKTGAKISRNEITTISSSSDGGSAICSTINGTLIIAGGEISYNTCTAGRGTVYVIGKCFVYGDANIINNTNNSSYSAGFYFADSRSYLYLGYSSCNDDKTPKDVSEWTGKIDGNNSKLSGSAISGYGTVYMNSGTISNNNVTESSTDTAAIRLYRGSGNEKFVMTGGVVKNNTTVDNPGYAFVMDSTPLYLSGSAYIPCGSDKQHCVYLGVFSSGVNGTINIAGKLEPPAECTDGIVAAVKPKTYDATANLSILTISDSPSPSTTLPAEVGKFALIPNPDAPTENWYISNEGILKGPVHLTVDSTSSNSIIKDTVDANDETIITLSNDFTMGVSNGDAYTNQIEISTGKKVEIKASTPVTITVPYVGDLFKINGGTLILGENVTIQPVNSFHWSFATVYQGGSLIIRGATIQNVNLSGSWHGLIHCSGGATITMESGSIKNCNDTAIYVYDATFIMNGGEISGNAGDYSSLNTGDVYAGGVTVESGGKFIKTGGSIHDNHVSNNVYNKTYETADWYLELEEPRPDYYSMYTPRNNVMFFAGAKYGTSLNSLTTYNQDTGFADDF